MELLLKYLYFVTFLHAVSSECDDVKFDIESPRLDHISITLSRIARKQRVIETQLKEKSPTRQPQHESVTVLDTTEDGLKDELLIMKRAFSSEKDYLRNLVKSLEMKMETKEVVQAALNEFGNRLEKLEKKVAELTVSSAVELRIESIEENLQSVETISDGLGDRIEAVERKLNSVETSSDDIERKVDSMEQNISSLTLASDKRVSFSAQYRPAKGNSALFQKLRRIPFNHVFYNDGEGYNATTGIFTVPVSGVYQFISFVEGVHKEDESSCPAAAVLLYIDGMSAGTAAVADPRHAHQHIQSGNAYINYFRKGQEVLVGTASSCDEYVIYAFRTTFHGILVY